MDKPTESTDNRQVGISSLGVPRKPEAKEHFGVANVDLDFAKYPLTGNEEEETIVNDYRKKPTMEKLKELVNASEAELERLSHIDLDVEERPDWFPFTNALRQVDKDIQNALQTADYVACNKRPFDYETAPRRAVKRDDSVVLETRTPTSNKEVARQEGNSQDATQGVALLIAQKGVHIAEFRGRHIDVAYNFQAVAEALSQLYARSGWLKELTDESKATLLFIGTLVGAAWADAKPDVNFLHAALKATNLLNEPDGPDIISNVDALYVLEDILRDVDRVANLQWRDNWRNNDSEDIPF